MRICLNACWFVLGTAADQFLQPSSHISTLKFQSAMDSASVVAFSASIGLSSSDATAILSQLEDSFGSEMTSHSLLDAFCLAAQLSLGSSKVDVAPLNQTVVEDNW
jgi:hypothetical protein